jgi:hypothetical protein
MLREEVRSKQNQLVLRRPSLGSTRVLRPPAQDRTPCRLCIPATVSPDPTAITISSKNEACPKRGPHSQANSPGRGRFALNHVSTYQYMRRRQQL